MAQVTKINHIAIAVNNIEEATAFWQDALGLRIDHIEDVASQNARVAFFPIEGSEVELVEPTSPDTGTANHKARCASRRQLRDKGIRLINETPLSLPGRRMAFIHPKSTSGVLVELYQIEN